MDLDYVVIPACILLIGVVVIWLSIRRMRSLSVLVSRRWRRVVERIVLSGVVVVTTVVAVSASYNAAALYWFRVHNPAPGVIYNVDGHKMRLDCMGSGAPTIILESGLGNGGLIWAAVQPELARTGVERS
jgi:hypothetical protein